MIRGARHFAVLNAFTLYDGGERGEGKDGGVLAISEAFLIVIPRSMNQFLRSINQSPSLRARSFSTFLSLVTSLTLSFSLKFGLNGFAPFHVQLNKSQLKFACSTHLSAEKFAAL